MAGPIQRMKRSQTALDDLAEKAAWKRPEKDALSAEQLDRFFAVRQRVDAVRRNTDLNLDQLPRKHVRTLQELKQVPGVIQGVSDLVGAEMDAFVAAGMPPAEYHWIERLVYERWRGPLRKAGTYPVALRAAAAEIEAAAEREKDAAGACPADGRGGGAARTRAGPARGLLIPRSTHCCCRGSPTSNAGRSTTWPRPSHVPAADKRRPAPAEPPPGPPTGVLGPRRPSRGPRRP